VQVVPLLPVVVPGSETDLVHTGEGGFRHPGRLAEAVDTQADLLAVALDHDEPGGSGGVPSLKLVQLPTDAARALDAEGVDGVARLVEVDGEAGVVVVPSGRPARAEPGPGGLGRARRDGED